jgi:type II secretory pathway pseudopilin PulG
MSRLRRLHEQDGMSLIELMTSVAMLLIVLVTFLTVLMSVNDGVQIQQERSIANDMARTAIERLDREVRSGNVLYNPADESLPYYSFRVYTQTNFPTRNEMQCVQWQVTTDNQLLRRSWPQGDPDDVTEWTVVADEIVNRSVTPNVPVFVRDPDVLKGGRTIDVTFMVDVDPADAMQRTVRIETSLTGRNTSYGYPEDACSPVPA